MAFDLPSIFTSDQLITMCGGLPTSPFGATYACEFEGESGALMRAQQWRSLGEGLAPRRYADDDDFASEIPWPSKLAQHPWASCVSGEASTAASSKDESADGESDDLPEGVTTLIVSNIPPRSSPDELVRAWPCRGEYNFLYVPYSAKRHRPSGFVFINFVSTAAALAFRNAWNGRLLTKGSTSRRLVVSVSGVQGFKENMLHCARAGLAAKKQCMPAVFDEQGARVGAARVTTTMRHLASADGEGGAAGSSQRPATAA